jgi:hypothetical protein
MASFNKTSFKSSVVLIQTPHAYNLYQKICIVNKFQPFLTKVLSYDFLYTLGGRIAHNVPAVYDIFAARIRACVARPGLQKCGGVLAWE